MLLLTVKTTHCITAYYMYWLILQILLTLSNVCKNRTATTFSNILQGILQSYSYFLAVKNRLAATVVIIIIFFYFTDLQGQNDLLCTNVKL